MSDEVKQFVRQHRPALLATVSPDGVPNIAPKGSLTVLDDERLVYADLVGGRTSSNLASRPQVAVVVIDQYGRGYQIKGRGQRDETGAAYERLCDISSSLKIPLPPPQTVMVIAVDEVSRFDPPKTQRAE
ncbi:MAG: pyridoxamine 5'-phosphate oxidase family protein [Methanomassiliicoccus sp.]|nr:pyridoxamine 5'-phosphate oxidase family protein [Methanomassiliicoccus sp.]